MKKIISVIAVLLALALMAGCGSVPEDSAPTDPTETTTNNDVVNDADDNVETESDIIARYTNEIYAQQIQRYSTALSQQWHEGTYFENEMSHLAYYYYDGNPLDNVGFCFMDLDGDGTRELIIGAIYNAELDPVVFEVWTLKNDTPVMLVQSGSRNRYYLQYAAEDDLWSLAYEAQNGAANHASYYLQLIDGEFQVMQGVIFDAMVNEEAPWFLATDLDWDVSNDTPTDEETATALMQAGRDIYVAADYIPYSLYQ